MWLLVAPHHPMSRSRWYLGAVGMAVRQPEGQNMSTQCIVSTRDLYALLWKQPRMIHCHWQKRGTFGQRDGQPFGQMWSYRRTIGKRIGLRGIRSDGGETRRPPLEQPLGRWSDCGDGMRMGANPLPGIDTERRDLKSAIYADCAIVRVKRGREGRGLHTWSQGGEILGSVKMVIRMVMIRWWWSDGGRYWKKSLARPWHTFLINTNKLEHDNFMHNLASERNFLGSLAEI